MTSKGLPSHSPTRRGALASLAAGGAVLAIPGLVRAQSETIRIGFDDINGQRGELETSDLLARVIQHELDHCEGVLFIDRLSPARRATLAKQIAEIQSDYASRT